MKNDNIELLRPSIINDNYQITQEVDNLSSALGKELGWHYIVDLVWTLTLIKKMNLLEGATILDAGAGNGILQYLLADLGYTIISVDYSNVSTPTLTKLLYSIVDMEGTNNNSYQEYKLHMKRVSNLKIKLKRIPYVLSKMNFNLFKYIILFWATLFQQRRPGEIVKYKEDMLNMKKIDSNSIDCIVSISAIEHLPFEKLTQLKSEFERVVKPGGFISLTTSATNQDDWFHKPSKGWCLSLSTILNFMGLPVDIENNFEDVNTIFEEYIQSDELKSRLSSYYYASGNNGMPWGFWDPKYIPVGIVKHVS